MISPELIHKLTNGTTPKLNAITVPPINPASNAPTAANSPVGRPLAKLGFGLLGANRFLGKPTPAPVKTIVGANNYLKHPLPQIPGLKVNQPIANATPLKPDVQLPKLAEDASAVYQRIMSPDYDPSRLLERAKHFDFQGIPVPDFVAHTLAGTVNAKNLGSMREKVQGIDKTKVLNFINNNASLFKGVQNFIPDWSSKVAADLGGAVKSMENIGSTVSNSIKNLGGNSSLGSAVTKFTSAHKQPFLSRLSGLAATPTLNPSEHSAVGNVLDGAMDFTSGNLGTTASLIGSYAKNNPGAIATNPLVDRQLISSAGKVVPTLLEKLPSMTNAAPALRGALGTGGKLLGAAGTVANYANEANTIKNYEGGWDKYMADGHAINSDTDTPGKYLAAAWENMGSPMRTNAGVTQGVAELPSTLMNTVKSGIRGQQQQAGISEALSNSINTGNTPLERAASGRSTIAMNE